jgi:hypothetical protein
MTDDELAIVKARYSEANPAYWVPKLLREIEALRARVNRLESENQDLRADRIVRNRRDLAA